MGNTPSRIHAPRPRLGQGGFTLIELLIVIAIIGTLAALVTTGITKVKGKAKEAEAKNDISNTLKVGINAFHSDMAFYPAYDKVVDEDELETFNAFPDLYEALCGEPRPKGRGGKNSPYAELNPKNLVVVNEDDPTGFSMAITDDVNDPEIEKFYLDPWGQPYYYRENSQKKRRDWMIRPKSYELWSIGPNGINEACYGLDATQEKGYDDIGSW